MKLSNVRKRVFGKAALIHFHQELYAGIGEDFMVIHFWITAGWFGVMEEYAYSRKYCADLVF